MDLEIAAGYGECSVCFEPLCTKGASVMTDGRGQQGGMFRRETLPKRVCRHFLCQEVFTTLFSLHTHVLASLTRISPTAYVDQARPILDRVEHGVFGVLACCYVHVGFDFSKQRVFAPPPAPPPPFRVLVALNSLRAANSE